jgi:hypothetical protein
MSALAQQQYSMSLNIVDLSRYALKQTTYSSDSSTSELTSKIMNRVGAWYDSMAAESPFLNASMYLNKT